MKKLILASFMLLVSLALSAPAFSAGWREKLEFPDVMACVIQWHIDIEQERLDTENFNPVNTKANTEVKIAKYTEYRNILLAAYEAAPNFKLKCGTGQVFTSDDSPLIPVGTKYTVPRDSCVFPVHSCNRVN